MFIFTQIHYMDGYHKIEWILWLMKLEICFQNKTKNDYMDFRQSCVQKPRELSSLPFTWLNVEDIQLFLPKSPKLMQFLEKILNNWITTYKMVAVSMPYKYALNLYSYSMSRVLNSHMPHRVSLPNIPPYDNISDNFTAFK